MKQRNQEEIELSSGCKLNFEALKSRQRKERDQYGEYLSVRVHRALSWLDRAEQCQDDNNAKVIFLWIAFNAAYVNDINPEYRMRERFGVSRVIRWLG